MQLCFGHIRLHGSRLLAAIAGALTLAACSHDVTAPRAADDQRGVYTLPVIEVVACQYGGEYPNCNPTPMPDGGVGPGGGGDGNTPPGSTAVCDPQTDPNCEKPLTSTDSTTILKAIRDFVRPDTAIADTVNRRKCKEMRDAFIAALSSRAVFRGGSNTTGEDSHYGMEYDSRIHFDPWLLNSAAAGDLGNRRELANTALHEAAHVLGLKHPNGETNGVYTDQPFNLLPPGPNVCIR